MTLRRTLGTTGMMAMLALCLATPAMAINPSVVRANRGQTVDVTIKGGLMLAGWNLECSAGAFTVLDQRNSESDFVSSVYVRTSAIVSLRAPQRSEPISPTPCPAFATVANVLAGGTLMGPLEIADDRGNTYIGSVTSGVTSIRVSPYCRGHEFLFAFGDTKCKPTQTSVLIPFARVTLITAVKNG